MDSKKLILGSLVMLIPCVFVYNAVNKPTEEPADPGASIQREYSESLKAQTRKHREIVIQLEKRINGNGGQSEGSTSVNGANRRWTVNEVKSELRGKEKTEVKAIFGPPDENRNGLWIYSQLSIYDPDSEKTLKTVMFDFTSSDKAWQVIVQRRQRPEHDEEVRVFERVGLARLASNCAKN